MNVVFISPHFPLNFWQFVAALRDAGANALAVADEPWERLRPELREAMTEYYRVPDMHRYEDMVRALGFLTFRHGKVDRIDSMSEYWLSTEARLREDFNVFGLRPADLAVIQRKTGMKGLFAKAGIPAAPAHLVRDPEAARAFVARVGYPLVAKPDVGVGALATYKIRDDGELARFFAEKPPVNYIVEEFVQGRIFSFDGLADRDGNLVFYTAHAYSQGIMETVNEDNHVFYYSLREIPPDLEDAGRRTARAFDVRERFFHFEFFRTDRDGSITALEVNMRPPGGLTTDMFNFANDIDIYREWARVVARNEFTASWSRPYHCGYVGRKWSKRYAHSHEEVLRAFGRLLPHHEEINSIFRPAIGDYGYLVRSKDVEELLAVARYIHETA